MGRAGLDLGDLFSADMETIADSNDGRGKALERARARARLADAPRVAVIVASRGRPEALGELLGELRTQSVQPDQIILSLTAPSDLPADAPCVDVVYGEAGLCAQRNRGMQALRADIEVVAFFDDDYVPRSDAIEGLAAYFRDNPAVVAAHGRLIADGINSSGISFNKAKSLLRESLEAPADEPYVVQAEALYGCNMVYRVAAIGDKRFDERLKLYGWQEDIDFSNQFTREGLVVSTNAFAGVHRGAKGARMSGTRFGYSQVVNPAYLVRKGTMRPRYALKICARNIAANLMKSLNPEPWVDRRGRLWGNVLGLWSLARGVVEPERVLDIR